MLDFVKCEASSQGDRLFLDNDLYGMPECKEYQYMDMLKFKSIPAILYV